MAKPILIVVDDELEMAEFIETAGLSLGFEVRIATSAEGFQKIWAEAEPSAIVMDIVMPDMDGIELLQWLVERKCTVPIILMSGYDGKYLDMTVVAEGIETQPVWDLLVDIGCDRAQGYLM
ncbi:MAG TPA: response regulator, partial [Rhodospirillaceae bacterium]|nr:response regulator [Rhodospirillaceae bacterium]